MDHIVTLTYSELSGALAMKRYKTSRNLPVARAVLLSFAIKKQSLTFCSSYCERSLPSQEAIFPKKATASFHVTQNCCYHG